MREAGVSRSHNLKMDQQLFDVLVVGGGINGAGIARDAAGRGLRVALCEREDLASHTSSRSTKLIHGGLRYLEHYEFKLVREALIEREVLLRAAPHVVWPLRFVLPHHKALRAHWLIRLGLWIYDHLGGRGLLPASASVDLHKDHTGEVLHQRFRRGFIYSDCWVQDARLVVLNAMDAAARGAVVMTRTEMVAALADGDHWNVTLRDTDYGAEQTLYCRAMVNAAGPWVMDTLDQLEEAETHKAIRLVAGSHFVVPRLFDHDHAYIFQNPDGRVVFAIPYEDNYTLIGTTEVEVKGDPGQLSISSDEIAYLCGSVNEYFRRPVAPGEIVWSYTGARALFDDDSKEASAVSRDYVLEMSRTAEHPPILSVFGGKITTYRKLAEQASDQLGHVLGLERRGWTHKSHLPGGDIENADFDQFLDTLRNTYPWLPRDLSRHYARNYGTLASRLLDGAGGLDDLGRCFGDGLYEAEVRYLVSAEWARTADDILWRRTKWGLHLSEAQHEQLRGWLADYFRS